MGKGRAPCCDKSQVKKGPWSPAEDLRLISFIQKHGHENWRALPKQAGLLRCGKSCRLRWINYLRPDVKRGNFSKEEEVTIINLHETLGNKWSKIASHLPGRTDNEIKNVWNTHLKKRLAMKEAAPKRDDAKESSPTSSSISSSSVIMSNGKRNMETELDQERNQGSVIKKSRILENVQDSQREQSNQTRQTEEQKELSSSSASSNNSNVTNSSQVNIIKPEDQVSLLSNYGPLDAYNILEEVNKPEIQDVTVGIPMESDHDFWNMLYGFSSFQYSNEVHLQNFLADKSSHLGDASNWEFETKKWLHYLESELGLEVTRDENLENLSKDVVEPLIPKNFQSEMLVKPKVDPGMGY